MNEPPARLLELLAAGRDAIARYTGTLLAVFVAQLVLTGTAVFAIARVLASAFARSPYFDRAVDGDLSAWVYLLRNHREPLAAAGWLGGGAVLLWIAVSWFVIAGVIGVLANQPEGRDETARCFGSSGASAFLPMVRLSVLSAPSYLVVFLALGLGIDAAAPHLERALTVRQLIVWSAIGIGPALLLLHVLWTITDYARAEIVTRQDCAEITVLVAYLRAISLVLRRPMTLIHSGLAWLLIIAISIGYILAAHGHPMIGGGGALTLLIVRQGVALARLVVHFAMIGGQVALTRQRKLPASGDGEARRRRTQ